MGKFLVNKGLGVITLGGKGYFGGDEIELNESQANNLKGKVTPVAVKEVETGEKALSDLSFDELKALADEKGLEVEGTGKNGAVKKDDVLKALAE